MQPVDDDMDVDEQRKFEDCEPVSTPKFRWTYLLRPCAAEDFVNCLFPVSGPCLMHGDGGEG